MLDAGYWTKKRKVRVMEGKKRKIEGIGIGLSLSKPS